MAGCSRATLYRVLARHNERVAAEIWEARLAHARRLLRHTASRGLSTSEVAYRSGFADASTFTRMFKRRHGVTPIEARAGRQ